jgi:hypothetical protein
VTEATRRIALAGAVLVAGAGLTARAQAPGAKGPLEAVQTLFQAMQGHDAALAATVLMPEGTISSVRNVNGKPVVRHTANREFIDELPKSTDAYLERIWDATVSRHGRLAIVTAPYDFHLNGVFSHCGVDVFEVYETEDGWRISGIAYTVLKEDCTPSPLGPPPPPGGVSRP